MTTQHRRLLTQTLSLLILLVFVLGNLLNLNAGWADSGDYHRIMTWYTSGPSYQPSGWPEPGSAAYQSRFYRYWIPYWKLDFPGDSQMELSVLLLWTPGVLLNQYFYSAETLYLPLLSLGPRLALFTFLCLVIGWVRRRSRHPELHLLALALPLALLFSTTDVAAFYNTFYQETGSIVFLAFLLAVIAAGQFVRRGPTFYLVYFIAILLAAASKSSLFYLPFLAVLGVISWAQLRSKPKLYLPLVAALTIVPALASLALTHHETAHPDRPYNSLITGTLLYSRDLDRQLEKLGLTDARDCIGVDVYLPEGRACIQRIEDRLGYAVTLKSLLNEPAILLRQVEHLASEIQNTHLELGLYAQDDPLVRRANRLNLWGEVQTRYFPRGWLLFPTMLVFGAILWSGRRQPGLAGDLVPVGWICLTGFWVDLLIQMLGDGPRDLLKHLLIANLLFDFLLIATLNIGLALLLNKITVRKKSETFS